MYSRRARAQQQPTRSDWASRLDSDVQLTLDAIRRIVRELREGSSEVEKRLGISSAQLFVLRTVAGAPGASLNDVAALTMTHQSSVSVVVRKLVTRKLLSRRRDAADGRRSELSLTARGESVLRRGPELAQERLIAAAGKLPRRDRRELARCLTALVENMGAAARPPAMFFEDAKAKRRGSK